MTRTLAVRTLAIRLVGALPSTLFFCAILVCHPSASRAQVPPVVAPTSASTPANNLIEARIKSLHTALHISSSEEPQWQAVAVVMRDNANVIGALVQDREAKTSTAVDDLHSYEAITEAHVAGVKKLIPVFEALYAVMPDPQKKTADAVFHPRPSRSSPKKSG